MTELDRVCEQLKAVAAKLYAHSMSTFAALDTLDDKRAFTFEEWRTYLKALKLAPAIRTTVTWHDEQSVLMPHANSKFLDWLRSKGNGK